MSTFSDYQIYARNIAKSLQRVAKEPAVSAQAKYYQANIGKVKTVADLVGNYRLLSYAMKSFGLEDTTHATAFMKKVLESDVNDSSSFVNKLSDKRYLAFAKTFNFTTKGTIASSAQIQTDDQEQDTLGLYTDKVGSSTATTTISDYYEKNIGSVTSADAFVSDSVLYNVALVAYGIDPTSVSQDDIKKVLESDVSDPKSYAEASGNTHYQQLAGAFNFAADGTIESARLAQTAKDVKAAEDAYTLTAGTDKTAKAAAKTETDYYDANIDKVTSVDDLLSDKRLVAYVLKANDLSGQTISTANLRKVLTSDVSDPKSYANQQSDPNYAILAASFHFNKDGSIARVPTQQIQSQKDTLVTNQGYLQQSMEDEAGKKNSAVQLALYFQRNASNIHTAYDILANKSLLTVVQTALNIPSTASKQDIDVQARAISNAVKLSDFQDPAKVSRFVARFAALYDLAHPAGATGTSLPVTNALMSNSSSTSSSSSSSIASLF